MYGFDIHLPVIWSGTCLNDYKNYSGYLFILIYLKYKKSTSLLSSGGLHKYLLDQPG